MSQTELAQSTLTMHHDDGGAVVFHGQSHALGKFDVESASSSAREATGTIVGSRAAVPITLTWKNVRMQVKTKPKPQPKAAAASHSNGTNTQLVEVKTEAINVPDEKTGMLVRHASLCALCFPVHCGSRPVGLSPCR
jgi:hypothetical protein